MGRSKLKVTGINHVVLHVTDLDRSRAFTWKHWASMTAACPFQV